MSADQSTEGQDEEIRITWTNWNASALNRPQEHRRRAGGWVLCTSCKCDHASRLSRSHAARENRKSRINFFHPLPHIKFRKSGPFKESWLSCPVSLTSTIRPSSAAFWMSRICPTKGTNFSCPTPVRSVRGRRKDQTQK